jgi:NAD(P)-dependent dehydrogenase (short-subunit alcohol dehydrogenase family)
MPPKNVLLTGASRGIGLAIARSLIREGCNVFVVARSAGALEELRASGEGRVEVLAGDVAGEGFEVCILYFDGV